MGDGNEDAGRLDEPVLDQTRRSVLAGLTVGALGAAGVGEAVARGSDRDNDVSGVVRGVVEDGAIKVGGRRASISGTDAGYELDDVKGGERPVHVFERKGRTNKIGESGNLVHEDRLTVDGDTTYDVTLDNVRYGWVRFREPTDWEGVKASIDRYAEFGITDLMVDAFYHGQTIWPSEHATHQQHVGQPNPPDDFLDKLLDYAHQKGMRVHAWFEGTLYWWDVNYFGDPPEGHILDGDDVITIDGEEYTVDRSLLTADADGNYADGAKLFVSPFSDDVVETVGNVIEELDTEYDIDGVNLDRVAYPESETEFGFGPSSPITTEMPKEERYRRRVERINEVVEAFGDRMSSETIYSVGTAHVFYNTEAEFRDPANAEIARNASHEPSDWIGTTGVDWITPYFYLANPEHLEHAFGMCQELQSGTVSVLPGLGALGWLPPIDGQYDVYDEFDLPGFGVFRASDLENELP